MQVVSGSSWGSGILLDKENGLFITNSHVIVSGAKNIYFDSYYFFFFSVLTGVLFANFVLAGY